MNTNRAACLDLLRSAPHVIEPGQAFVVDDFRPEDALGVARLYYTVYGEKFPIDYVYDPEELTRLNAGPDLHQVVGRTENGDVMGLYALFRNPPGRRIMEAGSWIVHPAYRNTSLAMRMARKINLQPPERLGLDVIFGQSVCNHIITQKMVKHFGAFSCALELEAMPAKSESHGGIQEGRVSLLDGVLIHHDRPHAVYLPHSYADFLRSMYATWGLDRELLEDRPAGERTVFTLQAMGDAGPVRITVEEPGRDFAGHLADLESKYPDRHVYQIVLPLWRPGCSFAVESVRQAGFFLGGILPQWFDRDGLLMQKVAGEPDVSRIQLYRQEAKDLLEVIMADRRSLKN